MYAMISILLLSSGLWDMSVTQNNQTVEQTFNFDGFKIMASLVLHCLCFFCVLACLLANNVTQLARVLPPIVIVTVLVFNFIFNLAGCGALWFHQAPQYPDGYSRGVRGGGAMSLVALALNLVILVIYCFRYPEHPSLRALGDPATLTLPPPQEGGSKEGDKEVKDDKEQKTKSAEGKKTKKNTKKKKGKKKSKGPPKTDSKEAQEPSSPDGQPGMHAAEEPKMPSNDIPADPTQPAKQQTSQKKEDSKKDQNQKQAENAPKEPEKPKTTGSDE